MKINPMNLLKDLDRLVETAYNKGWFLWAIAGALVIFLITIFT